MLCPVQLTEFIELADAPIFGVDAHGKVNEWNQKAAAITVRREKKDHACATSAQPNGSGMCTHTSQHTTATGGAIITMAGDAGMQYDNDV